MAKVVMQFQLDDRTTAGDLVQQFSRLHGFRDGRIPAESLDPLLHPRSSLSSSSSSSSSNRGGGNPASPNTNVNQCAFPVFNNNNKGGNSSLTTSSSSSSSSSVTRSTLMLLDDVTLLHLFEAGGNIGWRCLDPGTKMMALHRVNPSAKWIIQPRVAPFAVKRC